MIGQQVHIEASCPRCGNRMNSSNNPQSAFILATCQNLECENIDVRITIEKASGLIVWMAPDYVAKDGRRVYPVLADKEGNQVWPEK